MFYTVEEYAQMEGVNEKQPYEWVKKGELQSIEVGLKLPKLVYKKELFKEAKVIGLSNLKGGCGKTTVSVHLAIYLSKLEFKVLLIDTDHQNQCEAFFPPQSYEYTIMNILDGTLPIEKCIYKTETKDSKLDIIYSDYELATFAPKLTDQNRLKSILENVKKNYDFIIIDTSPNFDIINQNVARAATQIIIPIIPTDLHIRGLMHNIDGLSEIAHIDAEKVLVGILPNIVEIKTAQQRDTIEILQENYGDLIYANHIPKDVQVPKVTSFNTNIFDYAIKTKASSAYRKITWETLRRL